MTTSGYIPARVATEATDDYRNCPLATEDLFFPDLVVELVAHRKVSIFQSTFTSSSLSRTLAKSRPQKSHGEITGPAQ